MRPDLLCWCVNVYECVCLWKAGVSVARSLRALVFLSPWFLVLSLSRALSLSLHHSSIVLHSFAHSHEHKHTCKHRHQVAWHTGADRISIIDTTSSRAPREPQVKTYSAAKKLSKTLIAVRCSVAGTAERQASPSSTLSPSLLKFMSSFYSLSTSFFGQGESQHSSPEVPPF